MMGIWSWLGMLPDNDMATLVYIVLCWHNPGLWNDIAQTRMNKMSELVKDVQGGGNHLF